MRKHDRMLTAAFVAILTASLMALAGEKAILYDSGATITSLRRRTNGRVVGRSPRKPLLITFDSTSGSSTGPEDSFLCKDGRQKQALD
jgi:hypothetical protein